MYGFPNFRDKLKDLSAFGYENSWLNIINKYFFVYLFLFSQNNFFYYNLTYFQTCPK